MSDDRVKDVEAVRAGRPEGTAKVNLFQTARFFADVWVLRPGQAQAPHRHEREDKLVHVLSGAARARTGAQEHRLRAGQLLFCPAGEEHDLRNEGPDDLRVLVVMTPHPRPPAG